MRSMALSAAAAGRAVLLLALLAGAVLGAPCSRNQSRTARAILRRHVFSALGDFELPRDCTLDPARDRTLAQEAFKESSRNGRRWKCQLCGKVFRGEEWIDLHLDRKHTVAPSPSDTSVCLSDLCPVVGCDMYGDTGDNKHRVCKSHEMEARRVRCKHVVHKCFPPERGPAALRLHDLVDRALCEPMVCVNGRLPRLLLDPEAHGHTGYYVLVALVIMCMIVYYIFMYFQRRDYVPVKDLRRRQPRGGLFSWFGSGRQKEF